MVRNHCVPWQILFVGFVVWALAPFSVWFAVFLLAKRESGWGICGSSCCSVVFLVCVDLPAFMDQLCPCINVFSTAYAHVRTEPQTRHRPNLGGKNPRHHGAELTEEVHTLVSSITIFSEA